MRNVLVVGVSIELLMTIPMLLVRDDCALDEQGSARDIASVTAAAVAADGSQTAEGEAEDRCAADRATWWAPCNPM